LIFYSLSCFLNAGYNDSMHWVYYFGRFLIHIVVFPFGNWEVKGRENIIEKGPFLVICNHLHIADPPIVAASIPLKTVFMAKEELWQDGWSRFWVENFGAFPVSRGGATREAVQRAEDWLKKGVSLIMFPEGGRSRSARLQTAFPGAAFLALRMNVPILPVSITGTEKLRNLKWSFFHRPRVTVTIGRPFRPSSSGAVTSKEQREQLTKEMMGQIAALLPPQYRGVYGGGENA
jgi:1-acyl-sn-glycerol-3-phosphate acyltransferase